VSRVFPTPSSGRLRSCPAASGDHAEVPRFPHLSGSSSTLWLVGGLRLPPPLSPEGRQGCCSGGDPNNTPRRHRHRNRGVPMQLWLTVIQAAGTAVTLAAAVTNLTTALLARRRTQGGEAHRACRHRWRAAIRRQRTGKVTSVGPSSLAPVPYAARSPRGSQPCPERTDRKRQECEPCGRTLPGRADGQPPPQARSSRDTGRLA
jgi:hypothetical protein